MERSVERSSPFSSTIQTAAVLQQACTECGCIKQRWQLKAPARAEPHDWLYGSSYAYTALGFTMALCLLWQHSSANILQRVWCKSSMYFVVYWSTVQGVHHTQIYTIILVYICMCRVLCNMQLDSTRLSMKRWSNLFRSFSMKRQHCSANVLIAMCIDTCHKPHLTGCGHKFVISEAKTLSCWKLEMRTWRWLVTGWPNHEHCIPSHSKRFAGLVSLCEDMKKRTCRSCSCLRNLILN